MKRIEYLIGTLTVVIVLCMWQGRYRRDESGYREHVTKLNEVSTGYSQASKRAIATNAFDEMIRCELNAVRIQGLILQECGKEIGRIRKELE